MVEAVRDVDSTYDNLLNKVYTRAGNMQMVGALLLPRLFRLPAHSAGWARVGKLRVHAQVVVGEREMAVHSDFSLYLRTIEADLSFSQASARRSAAADCGRACRRDGGQAIACTLARPQPGWLTADGSVAALPAQSALARARALA